MTPKKVYRYRILFKTRGASEWHLGNVYSKQRDASAAAKHIRKGGLIAKVKRIEKSFSGYGFGFGFQHG